MRLLFLAIGLVLTVGLVGCSESFPTESVDGPAATQLAKKPFVGTNYALFNPGIFVDHTKPSWYGSFTAGGVDYGEVFFSLGSGKPYPHNVTGQAFHAKERFEVYTWIEFDPETQTLETGELLMVGINTGVQVGDVFHAHGRILEAYGPFEGLAGRPQSGRAVVEWAAPGLPYSASGVMNVPW